MSDKYVPLDRLRSFSETVSLTFELIRQAFKPLMVLVISIAGPFIVIGAIGTEYTNNQTPAEAIMAALGYGSTAEPVAVLPYVLALFVNVAASIVGYVVVIIYFLEYHRLKRLPTIQEARAALKGVWPRAFGAYIVVVLCWIAGALCFLIPGVYLWVALSLTVVCLFVEGLSVGEALKRSRLLIKHDWWWAFLYLFLIYTCAAIVAWIAEIPGAAFSIVDRLTTDTAGESTTMVVQVVGSVIRVAAHIVVACFSALIATAIVILYYREVERTEGGGLLERINTIGNDAVPPPHAESY